LLEVDDELNALEEYGYLAFISPVGEEYELDRFRGEVTVTSGKTTIVVVFSGFRGIIRDRKKPDAITLVLAEVFELLALPKSDVVLTDLPDPGVVALGESSL
jgi:hypothetical protein